MEQADGKRPDRAAAAGAVARVVAILEAVADAEGSVGVRELARGTGVDKSAVSRLLAQLLRLEMVEQAPGGQGRYTVGPRFFAISGMVAARDSLIAAARPIMRTLVDDVEETCYLATFDNNELVFRDKADCHKPIRYVLEMGRPIPIHAGAGGRAVLAAMTPEEAGVVLRQAPLEPLTARTVIDPNALLELAEQDRGRGYSVSIGERVIGGSAIASPYFLSDGTCRGALVLTIPAERLRVDLVPHLGAAVAAAAKDLSTRLGYRGTWHEQRPVHTGHP
jgi:DNA-binding IclR family transcriptional regulator